MTSGGLAAVSSSAFAALYSAFGKYDVVHIHAEGPAFFAWLPKMFGKRVVVTVHGIDWQREKWQSGLGSKFIHQGEKNAVKYADEIIVLSKGVQDYFKETYGRKTHFRFDFMYNKKSFMAGCIANALMEQEVAVCMTNFARIMNELNNAFSGRNKVVDRLCGYPLLIIDDFGMERGTEYALEQIYNIIDSRYRSRKPLIVTTNLTLTELKYRVLKKLGPSFNCRFSAAAVDSPCKRIPISEELLEEIVRNALTVQIKQAEHVLEILHERERKALICFSALERQEEKLSAEKAEIVKLRVALYEQYADGNMSKKEFIRQRDAYRVQEDERMEQIQRLRTEKNQVFQTVKKDTDNLQAVMNTVGEAGDVMHLSQNVVKTFIDRIEIFNDERVKIRFTFEDALNSYEEK